MAISEKAIKLVYTSDASNGPYLWLTAVAAKRMEPGERFHSGGYLAKHGLLTNDSTTVRVHLVDDVCRIFPYFSGPSPHTVPVRLDVVCELCGNASVAMFSEDCLLSTTAFELLSAGESQQGTHEMMRVAFHLPEVPSNMRTH